MLSPFASSTAGHTLPRPFLTRYGIVDLKYDHRLLRLFGHNDPISDSMAASIASKLEHLRFENDSMAENDRLVYKPWTPRLEDPPLFIRLAYAICPRSFVVR